MGRHARAHVMVEDADAESALSGLVDSVLCLFLTRMAHLDETC